MSKSLEKLLSLPKTVECRLCEKRVRLFDRLSLYCEPCRKISDGFELQAAIDAHQAFSRGGCDMYGSQADPKMDLCWLDGYQAARYDDLVKAWKKANMKSK